jgi:hypothetical protein
MAWDAAAVAATQLVTLTTEQFFSFPTILTLITLNPGEWIEGEANINFPVTPTDHCILAAYPSIDGGSTFANTAAQEWTIDKALDPNRYPFIFTGFSHFRLGVRRSGTTDTITSADMKFKKSGVNL